MKKIILLCLSVFMMMGCSNQPATEDKKEQLVQKQEMPAASEEFLSLMKQYEIEDKAYEFKNKEFVVFASGINEETIEVMAFGYEKDIAQEMYDTVYMDVSNYDEETVQKIDQQMKNRFDVVNKEHLGTATFEKQGDTYVIEIHVDDFSLGNLKKLNEKGILLIGGQDEMSEIQISKLLAGIKEGGFIIR